jgi:hypothetical protein
MPEVKAHHYPECFEPYLRYAISTDFRNFESFDEKTFSLFLLVELHEAKLAADFERKIARFDAAFGPEFGREFGPYVGHTRYVTMRASKAAVLEHSAFDIWNDYVDRVELSLPVKPSTLEAFAKKQHILPRFEGSKELLIGVLDDGCPFAAAQFLKTLPNNAVGTRVRGIWDQNKGKEPVTISGNRQFGQPLPDFNYGLEYRRDFAASIAPGPVGLDEWINLHSTPTGGIDEVGCYADAGFTSLKRGLSHGAHVMDVLAGRIPTSSRVGPSPPRDRRDPPSWKPGTDPASSADVVFVQFSDDCIRDATGVWLKSYVVEGIQYILSFAEPYKTENVVINLSYGPTTGPHDGTAELEAALTALVTQFDGTHGKPKLEIVVPAGNAYFSEGHVVFTRPTMAQPDQVEWTWRLPSDNSVLCFAEIWMETAAAGNVYVTLTPPSGYPVFVPTPPPNPPPPPGALLPPAGVDVPLVRGNNTMWRLQVEPTIIPSNPAPNIATAEHGDWTIKITGIGAGAHVHAYVARSDPNMGVRTGAKRSYFVDHNWELNRSAIAGCEYRDGEFDKARSLIHRVGTLNGIATAKDASVHVAGGYVIANGRKSPYSSAGPARGGPRIGPDVVLPCDESYALAGIRAGGNRSGAVFRLIGTSAAAPQLARYVARLAIPPPHDPPTSLVEKYKRGSGDLDPP